VKREVLKREKEEKVLISVVWNGEKLRRESFFMGPTPFSGLLYPAKKGVGIGNSHLY